ncbi:MAG: CCA tRNA nucleotidyltransferase [Thermogutta sp.]
MAATDPEKQREFAVSVVRTLRQRGYLAYWAGGCVRDQVLGRVPKDYDVATNATPDEVRKVFGFKRTLAVGAAFGVIAVNGPPGAGQIEVATFRTDSTYRDGRHPESVSFSGPQEDALRRDFTINGLFYDPIEDRVVDYVGGVDDINRRLIKAIGDPRQRFEEDKLRMLRAIRFVAELEFDLDKSTYEAIRAMAPQITQVSHERILMELERLLTAPGREKGVRLLRESGLWHSILPELEPTDDSSEGQWDMNLRILARLEEPGFPLAFAVLACGLIAPTGIKSVCRRLRMSNQQSDKIQWLLENEKALDGAEGKRWSAVQPILISPHVEDLLKFMETRAHVEARPLQSITWCRQRLRWPREELDPPPLIRGDDLLKTGMVQGPLYREILEQVRKAQLDGMVTNREEALKFGLEIAKMWLLTKDELGLENRSENTP